MGFILVFFLLASGQDALSDALKKVGLTTEDLGYKPKGYWSRYPDPGRVPHKLPFFDDLFREPLEIPIFARSLAHVAEDYLGKDYKKRDRLYQCLYFFGVDKLAGVFRNYGANLSAKLEEKDPLYSAYFDLLRATSHQENFLSFGGAYEEEDSLKKAIGEIPLDYQRVFSRILINILDAYRFWELAMRRVDMGKLSLLETIDDLDETQSGGEVYYPELDDIKRDLDDASLAYATLKVAQAVEIAMESLDSLRIVEKLKPFRLEMESPIGDIVISNEGDEVYRGERYLLIIDLKGNDRYEGRIAAGIYPDCPISVLIDLSGDDTYKSEDLFGSQGAGIGGIGILLDSRGNDTYLAGKGAQGYGLLGYGVLWDLKGSDSYTLTTQGQGCGMMGVGVLLDSGGDDSYYLYGNGQGDGEFGGIGVLADRYGDDHYKAEPFSQVYNRGDYHSKGKINANNAQGFGGGRRGDGSDGHSWAGGLGVLIDIEGDDLYESGNWSKGCGYWYGVGILYDGSGDDTYRSCYFTQASGAHYAIGALIDEGGNDMHILFETKGAALAFGWDFTIAYFEDDGGDDLYDAGIISLGTAEIRSNALFLEMGGDDVYKVNWKTLKLGASDYRKGYRYPNRYSPYIFSRYTKNIGIFLDLGGNDRYELRGKVEGNESIYGNNRFWLQPVESDTTYGYGNFGIGWDLEGGEIQGLNPWRSQKTSR
jgi:hypothetical protein